MTLFQNLIALNDAGIETLKKAISQQIIKDPQLDSKAVSKSLSVLDSLVILNRIYDFNETNLIIDNQDKAIVQRLIEQYFNVSTNRVFVSNHSSDALGVSLAIALENDAQTIALVDNHILNYGKTYESLIQIANYTPNLTVIFYDAEDALVKSHNLMDNIIKNVRLSSGYSTMKKDIKKVLNNKMGQPLLNTLSKVRNNLKEMMIEPTIFSQFYFNYHGAIDGHNSKELTKVFERTDTIEGANLIHLKIKANTLRKLKLPSFKTESGIPDNYMNYMDAIDKVLSDYDDITVCVNIKSSNDHMAEFVIKNPDHYYVNNGTYHSMIDFVKGLLMLDKKVVIIMSSYQYKHVISLINEQINQPHNVLFIIRDAGLNEKGDVIRQGIYDVGLSQLYTSRILMGKDIAETLGLLRQFLDGNNDLREMSFTVLRVPNKLEKEAQSIPILDQGWEYLHQPEFPKGYVISYGPTVESLKHKAFINNLDVAIINARDIFNVNMKILNDIESQGLPLYVYDLEDVHHTLYRMIRSFKPNLKLVNLSLVGTDLTLQPRDLKLRYKLNTDHVLNLIIKNG